MTKLIAPTGNDARTNLDTTKAVGRMLGDMLGAAQLRFGAAARAHDRRLASARIGADTTPDTGVATESASGLQVWQADLPFFMQSGFGKR